MQEAVKVPVAQPMRIKSRSSDVTALVQKLGNSRARS